jgi:hypothetical protein
LDTERGDRRRILRAGKRHPLAEATLLSPVGNVSTLVAAFQPESSAARPKSGVLRTTQRR